MTPARLKITTEVYDKQTKQTAKLKSNYVEGVTYGTNHGLKKNSLKT